ncbi:MAG: DUF2490 domain-containing protein [Saprospiraceae bacterium]|nr:DUF2490 domain-containing protein [Saprospiraceae bacterium]
MSICPVRFLTDCRKKDSYKSNLGDGFLIRLREGKLINRIVQQFIITKKYPGLLLSHRFAFDQTFSRDTSTEFRLRYRLSSEIPLNGQSVDAREFYIKLSNEYLNSFQRDNYDLEIRLSPFLGYELKDSQKLELGLDFRINSFLNGSPASRFWIGFNWYQSFSSSV